MRAVIKVRLRHAGTEDVEVRGILGQAHTGAAHDGLLSHLAVTGATTSCHLL